MKTEIIEKYIQFAIDNGYKLWWIEEIDRDFLNSLKENDLMYTFVITSKEFIEAVARGAIKRKPLWWEYTIFYSKIDIERYPLCDWVNNKEVMKSIIDDITYYQAIAIRDNKLEDFINNILNNK